MRKSFAFTFVAACAMMGPGAADEQVLTLEQAYGPVAPVSSLLSWSQRKSQKRSSFTGVADSNGRQCTHSLDLVIVQDASLNSTVASVYDELDSIYSVITDFHQDSRIGLVSFVDRPKFPYGGEQAYCYRMESELSNEFQSLTDAYGRLKEQDSDMAGDIWNSQFDAVLNTVQSNQIAWSNFQKRTVRLIVLATATPPHFALDGLNIYGLPQWSNQAIIPDQCLAQYYPGPDNVFDALEETETYVMFAIMPGLAQTLAYLNYLWLSSFLGFTADFVSTINSTLPGGSSSLTAAISSAVDLIATAECTGEPVPATTAAPATIAPTTIATVTAVPATTATPATIAPTTIATVTAAPTTIATLAPTTTVVDTTIATTVAPTTAATMVPTTVVDTTIAPTTVVPTTVATSTTACGNTDELECNAPGSDCDAVLIQLKHRPKKMELLLKNE